MRPGVLDIGRRRYRVALDEGGVVDVDAVERELRPDGGIEHGPARRALAKESRGDNGAATPPASSVVNARRSIMVFPPVCGW